MASLEAQARQLGIPMMLDVDDGLRFTDCVAHEATLVSIEGDHAIYQGVCPVGHHYEQRFEIAELQKMAHIENGEIVYGGETKEMKAPPLQEF